MARFMTAFAGVIAVTKDLPDIAGDLATGVPTLATKFGVGRVAAGATLALLVNYMTAIAQGLASSSFKRLPMVGHALLAGFLLRNYRRYRQAGAEDPDAVGLAATSIWDNVSTPRVRPRVLLHLGRCSLGFLTSGSRSLSPSIVPSSRNWSCTRRCLRAMSWRRRRVDGVPG